MKILRGACMPAALIVTLLCTWLACSKNQKAEACITCRSKPPELVKTMKVIDQDLAIGIFKKTRYDNLILAKAQHESEQTSSVLKALVLTLDKENYFKKLLQRGYVPVNYNLFAQLNVKTSTAINTGDIRAISVVLYYDKGLHHYLFAKDGSGGLTVDQRFTAVTDQLNLEDKYLVFEKLTANRSDIISLVTVVNPSYVNVMDDVITTGRLKYRLLKPATTDARAIPVTSFGDEDRCDPDVCLPIQDQKGKCVEVIGGYGCKEEEDGPCAAKTVAVAARKSTEFAAIDDALYTMKWYVLEESVNGRDIIDKYYQTSTTVKSHILSIDLVKAYGLLSTLDTKVRNILADTESEEILFDSNTRDEALAFLESIRGLEGSRQWTDNIDWLKGLLIRFANRPVREVFAHLNS